MKTSLPKRPLFTLRTDDLAGRLQEQEKLRQALDSLQPGGIGDAGTQLVYITGTGGMGKTRMLEWVSKTAADGEYTHLICIGIIDFYNSHLRSDVDLVEEIAAQLLQQLDEESKKLFKRFEDTHEKYRTQQFAGIETGTRREVMDEFETAWRKLAARGRGLVVLLDTAELLRFDDDHVRAHFNAYRPTMTARSWLRTAVEENRLPRTLFVAAGRHREAPDIYSEFRALAKPVTGAHAASDSNYWVIDLEGLTRTGVGEYVRALANTLRSAGFKYDADRLAEIVDDGAPITERSWIDAFYDLTGGSPIALAIALQIFLDGENAAPVLWELITKLMQKDPAEGDLIPARQDLRTALVRALGEYAFGIEASVVVRYMALARRGLTPARFRILDETQDFSLETLQEVFLALRDQIFIKQRPDGSLVLHDEVGDWLEEGLWPPGEQKRKVFQKLVEAYDRQIQEIEEEIQRLNSRSEFSDEEVESDVHRPSIPLEATAATEEQRRLDRDLLESRQKRRRLIVDRMGYALRWDPVEGYKHYYELAEEAFSVAVRDYEADIRAVFLEWWNAIAPDNSYLNRSHAADRGLIPQIVDGDLALRVVQRAYLGYELGTPLVNRVMTTLDLTQRILEAADFVIPQHTHVLLEVYANLCRGQLEGEEKLEEVRAAFDRCMAALEQEKRTHGEWRADLQGWLIHAAKAFGYYAYGFFERSRGRYGRAALKYTASLLPYRDLKFEVGQARSLNDKAYALALVGDSLKAEAAVKDALNLRLRLGYGYPIALSLNTYGIVLTMNERPVSAEYYCQRALEIFHKIDNHYGQMLAHRALSEAYRRDAERLTQARGHYLRHLENALAESEQSYAIAERLLQPPNSLLADILDEYGCVYRDLAHFCWQNPDECTGKHDANESFHQAEVFLRQSIQAVEGIDASERRVDSAVNLAYLYYWRIDSVPGNRADANERQQILTWLDEAEARLEEAMGFVPEEYQNPAHARHQRDDPSNYWTHLSKAWSLAALIVQERRLLVERAEELTADKDKEPALEDELLRSVMRILYYASRLPGNVRTMRRALQITYDVLKSLASDTLERFYAEGAQLFPAEERDAWQRAEKLLQEHLRDNFGIGDYSLK